MTGKVWKPGTIPPANQDDIYFGDACAAYYRLEVVCLPRLNKLQLHSASGRSPLPLSLLVELKLAAHLQLLQAFAHALDPTGRS